MKLIDTHAHLYWDDYKSDLGEVIQRAIDAGVDTAVVVGVDVITSQKAVDFTHYPLPITCYATAGIHPHEAYRYFNNDELIGQHIDQLEQLVLTSPNKVKAIGECGLDFFFEGNHDYQSTDLTIDQQKKLQIKLLESQVLLAKKLDLPLVVHCRDAKQPSPLSNVIPAEAGIQEKSMDPPVKPEDDNTPSAWNEVLDLIKDSRGILHCYSGDQTITQKALQTKFMISFAANITYPKNQYLRDAATIIPLDHIVLETDCPFLSPQSSRGKRNEPRSVRESAEFIAQLRGITVEEIATQTTANAKKVFRI